MIVLISAILIIHLIFLFNLIGKKDDSSSPDQWPKISIWVAARNEETQIQNCLASLAQLDYPADKIQILVGDDQSEDRTAEVIKSFITDKPQFHYVWIDGTLGKAKKKANVLAHLAHQSNGDYFLFCDADIQVHPQWAKSLVRSFKKNIGVVSATTGISGNNWFSRMQNLDWLYFMGLIKSASNVKIPCTAVGNNMAVSREAYFKTGGYENIPFSITEDYMLFKQILIRGYDWKHLLTPTTTSASAASPDFRTLMLQRKRWLTGGRDLPFYWKMLLALFGLFDPLILVCFFILPYWALMLFCLHFVIQSSILILTMKGAGKHFPFLDILSYSFYSSGVTAATALFFPFSSGREWKGRKY
ncbi:MAG: glycosyltransferase [Bacteroidetes bacterium]|nr:glycosyltransferase [Bacteroidota bacterium]